MKNSLLVAAFPGTGKSYYVDYGEGSGSGSPVTIDGEDYLLLSERNGLMVE